MIGNCMLVCSRNWRPALNATQNNKGNTSFSFASLGVGAHAPMPCALHSGSVPELHTRHAETRQSRNFWGRFRCQFRAVAGEMPTPYSISVNRPCVQNTLNVESRALRHCDPCRPRSFIDVHRGCLYWCSAGRRASPNVMMRCRRDEGSHGVLTLARSPCNCKLVSKSLLPASPLLLLLALQALFCLGHQWAFAFWIAFPLVLRVCQGTVLTPWQSCIC